MSRLTPLLLLPLLAACEQQPRLALSPHFGNAVSHNMAIQAVNPDSRPVGVAAFDGQRANDAMVRYRDGKVTQTESISTSEVGAR